MGRWRAMGVQTVNVRNLGRDARSADMGFRARQRELAELTDSAASGLIQLPDFQRDYRSSDEQVRQLLVAVAQGHPIGAVLVLAVGARDLRLQTVSIEGAAPA